MTESAATDLEYRSHTPILFVHGAWHGSWCWNENWTPYFTDAGFEVRSITLPKHHNQGSKRRIWPSMGLYVRKVRAHLEEMGPNTVLVGHSMGGYVVQRALERRTKARGAVLLASVPRNGVGPLVVKLFRKQFFMTARMLLTFTLWPVVNSEKRVRDGLFTPDTDGSVVADTYALLQNESYRAYLHLLFRRVVPRRLCIPIAVVAAERDALFPVQDQERLARAHGAELRVIEGSGHDIMLDSRWQEAADEVIAWIDQL